MEDKLIIQKVNEEQFQYHSTRIYLYDKLEEEFKIPVISFFTSFKYPVSIEDNDADMLEGILQKSELSKGFILLLSSPGGSGLTAERIINICRNYSGTEKYDVIIPGKAKSAASMICIGASKIIMGKNSELGPIDPQIIIEEDNKIKWFSIYNIVKSYEDLFKKAINEKGNLQPYLQQLQKYDSREIQEFRAALSLSEDIATKTLKTGMFSNLSKRTIRNKIKLLLTLESVKTHGRPIYSIELKKCGFNLKVIDIKSTLWSLIYELYIRLSNYVSSNYVAKCIESKKYSFIYSIKE